MADAMVSGSAIESKDVPFEWERASNKLLHENLLSEESYDLSRASQQVKTKALGKKRPWMIANFKKMFY